jgi:predicted heme/steroid binding protein
LEHIEDDGFRFGSFVAEDEVAQKHPNEWPGCESALDNYSEDDLGTWDVVIERTFVQIIRRVGEGSSPACKRERMLSAPARLVETQQVVDAPPAPSLSSWKRRVTPRTTTSVGEAQSSSDHAKEAEATSDPIAASPAASALHSGSSEEDEKGGLPWRLPDTGPTPARKQKRKAKKAKKSAAATPNELPGKSGGASTVAGDSESPGAELVQDETSGDATTRASESESPGSQSGDASTPTAESESAGAQSVPEETRGDASIESDGPSLTTASEGAAGGPAATDAEHEAPKPGKEKTRKAKKAKKSAAATPNELPGTSGGASTVAAGSESPGAQPVQEERSRDASTRASESESPGSQSVLEKTSGGASTPAAESESAGAQPVPEETRGDPSTTAASEGAAGGPAATDAEHEAPKPGKKKKRKAKKAKPKASPVAADAATRTDGRPVLPAAPAPSPPSAPRPGARAGTEEVVPLAKRRQLMSSFMAVFREQQNAGAGSVPSGPSAGAGERAADHVGTITPEELATFDHRNARRLVSVYGDIFDVSGSSEFRTGGVKSELAGKDITWGVLTGVPKAQNCNRFYDVFKGNGGAERRLPGLCHCLALYEAAHGRPVGRLAPWDREEELPAAPPSEEALCTVQ